MHALILRLHLLRLQGPIALLILLLQRNPVLQFLARAEAPPPSAIANLLRSGVVVTAAAGAMHTLTGATTFSSTPASPASATVGQAFTLSFSVTGAPTSTRSYSITGTMPPGLSVPGINGSGVLNAATGTISGTPTAEGSYTVNIQAWDRVDARGNSDDVLYPVRINVAAAAAIAPTISAQPAPLTLNVGGSGSFTVTASGTPAPSYQWRKNGTNISGAISATLNLTNVQTGDAGNYSVVVSNTAGSVTSNAVALTVNVPAVAPTISIQPSPLTLTVGSGGSFSVTASGTPAPSYQWRKNGTNISGAISATLNLTNVQTTDAGNYSVVVSNTAGSVTSNAVALTVNVPAVAPTISIQPSPLTLTVGSGGSFSVTASGTPAPSYQWRKNGTNISGAISATLNLTNVQTTDAGNYSVVVSNTAGSVTSNAVALTVNAAAVAPTISAQPAPLTLNVGGSGGFSVTASGTPAPSYQWRKNGTNISGAISATLNLTNVQTTDAGNYSVVVSNTAGSVTSNAVALTVNVAATSPTITVQPRSLMLPAGYSGTLVVQASGSGTLTYRWSKNGASLAGATSATLTLTGVQMTDAGNYTVTVSNNNGSTTSNVARVSVGTNVARLGNMSTRGFVGSGNQILIAGLVINGTEPKSLLIRAVGPGLVPHGLGSTEVLADPVLTLHDVNGTEVYSNDDWGDAANASILAPASESVGAFAIAAGSKDAVALVTLSPGIYTVSVSGKNGASGIALAEAYELH